MLLQFAKARDWRRARGEYPRDRRYCRNLCCAYLPRFGVTVRAEAQSWYASSSGQSLAASGYGWKGKERRKQGMASEVERDTLPGLRLRPEQTCGGAAESTIDTVV